MSNLMLTFLKENSVRKFEPKIPQNDQNHIEILEVYRNNHTCNDIYNNICNDDIYNNICILMIGLISS